VQQNDAFLHHSLHITSPPTTTRLEPASLFHTATAQPENASSSPYRKHRLSAIDAVLRQPVPSHQASHCANRQSEGPRLNTPSLSGIDFRHPRAAECIRPPCRTLQAPRCRASGPPAAHSRNTSAPVRGGQAGLEVEQARYLAVLAGSGGESQGTSE
jgi:hypothetical protein